MKRTEFLPLETVIESLNSIFQDIAPMLYKRLEESNKAENESQAIQTASSGYGLVESVVALVLLFGPLLLLWPNV